MIRVNNLVKRYGNVLALDHFSMEVQEGEIFGLLGPNGSGKTTAMNCILSLLTYDKGEIFLFGEPVSPHNTRIKQQIGVVMQNVAVFQELTVAENIDYFCSLYVPDRKKRSALVEEAMEFTGITAYRKFFPRKLSGGLLRRLNIACGIAHKPRLIFFDEPTVAVDPQSRSNILTGIKELNRKGATIIYTSHYMEEVEQICTRVMIMDQGRPIATGTREELKSLIRTGETITVEACQLSGELTSAIGNLPGVLSLEYHSPQLVIHCESSQHVLLDVLDMLRQKEVPFGKVFSEPPTLNDVFLSITGKQLRD